MRVRSPSPVTMFYENSVNLSLIEEERGLCVSTLQLLVLFLRFVVRITFYTVACFTFPLPNNTATKVAGIFWIPYISSSIQPSHIYIRCILLKTGWVKTQLLHQHCVKTGSGLKLGAAYIIVQLGPRPTVSFSNALQVCHLLSYTHPLASFL